MDKVEWTIVFVVVTIFAVLIYGGEKRHDTIHRLCNEAAGTMVRTSEGLRCIDEKNRPILIDIKTEKVYRQKD